MLTKQFESEKLLTLYNRKVLKVTVVGEVSKVRLNGFALGNRKGNIYYMCLSHKYLTGNEKQAAKDTLIPLLFCGSNLLMMHFRNRASLSAAGMKYHFAEISEPVR